VLRRHGPLVRQRADRLAHMHNTTSQDTLPEMGQKLADKTTRAGVEAYVPAPRGRKPIEGEGSLSAHYAHRLGEVELYSTRRATAHAGQPLSRLQSVPGSGQMLALVIWSERHEIPRFPRVPDFVSSCRVVNCAKESGGKRLGTAGQKLGTGPWRWACAEAAVLFLRQSQPGKEDFATLERNHGNTTALTGLAPKVGRAVDSRLTRAPAVELQRLVPA
jgi:transposase